VDALTGAMVITGSDTITTSVPWIFTDAMDISFGAVTGTKIGTSTLEKLAFYNSTPSCNPARTRRPTRRRQDARQRDDRYAH